MLYWFTGSDKQAQEHYLKSVEQKVDLMNFNYLITINERIELQKRNVFGEVNLWGAVPGPSNKRNWNAMDEGDYVIGYQDGYFKHFGKVLFKMHNKALAEKIWGSNKDGKTWEYIYIFELSDVFSLSAKKFSMLFKYRPGFHPQGFSRPSTERLDYVVKQFGSISNGLTYYQNSEIEVELKAADEQFADQQFNESVGKILKKSINITPRDYSPRRPNTNQRSNNKTESKVSNPRDPNVTAKALQLANNKCEFDSSHHSYLTNEDIMFTEGHHLIPMKYYQDFSLKDVSIDHISNVVSLCPNCHSQIHRGKDKDRKRMIEKLFKKRRKRLKDAGINIELSDLNLYYIQ